MGLVAKAFQDIITFSRASSGTYVNSNGYITNSSVLNYLTYSNQPENAAWTKSNSFVQQNLVTYSQEFDNAAWTTLSTNVVATPNTTIAPDGTLTADTIASDAVAAQHFASQSTSISATTAYTFSVYGKVASTQYLQITTNLTAGSAQHYATFDLSTGTVSQVGSSATASIQSVGNGWYRCICTMTTVSASAANTVLYCVVPTGTGGRNPSYTGSTSVYIWGAQLVQGSVPGDYRATTTAALPCLYADYNGALRARKLCENNAATTQHALIGGSLAVTPGLVTLSVKVKPAERTVVGLYANTIGKGQYFNLATGTVGATLVSAPVSASIAYVDDGFYLCSITVNAGSFEGLSVYLTDGSTITYTGDGSSGIYIADAQLNDGSSALAYYDTTASAYNAPRFDYDPVTLAAKGLLVEEQRANLLTYSNDWSNAVWAKTNITRTAAAALGPDGTFSMTKLGATASAGTSCSQAVVATATSHTYSIYVKQGSAATDANSFLVFNTTTATVLAQLTVNYATGVITQTVGTGATAVNSGNSIWRIVIPVTSGITIGNSIFCYSCFAGAPETAGEFAYASQAQFEAGAFATSVIPTVASQVTRAADVASVNTLSPWYNSVAGTLYAEWDYIGDGSTSNPNTRTTVGISDGTSNNRFQIYNISGNTGGLIQTGGVTQAALDAGATTAANTIVKGALAYATNDAAYSRNGGAPSTDVSVTLPTVNVMYLGTEPAAQRLSGHLRRITYYPRRLTNAELQTLTTL